MFPNRRVELVVYDGVLLVSAGGEGEGGADLDLERECERLLSGHVNMTHLQGSVPRNVQEDGVTSA